MTSGDLFAEEQSQVKKALAGPVTCLGKTFENDEARRAYFTEELRKKLQDPEFRKIEGFPLGEDEDILNLSDPPYYTACPNPWVADFVAQWNDEKTYTTEYHREPFAADVSESRSGLFYDAHSYHTKVPHKAIMRYILHYTSPGDTVFDSFCGTGMTGVAAQLCGDVNEVVSLGYQVKPDGTVLQEGINELGQKEWISFSKIGIRHAVLNDLSPAAAFISYNFNTPINTEDFYSSAKRLIEISELEHGWIYETSHLDGKAKGKINYIIWSDVFICPNCSADILFWDAAVNHSEVKLKDSIDCFECGASHDKKGLERVWFSQYSISEGEVVKKAKQVPVFINYFFDGKRYDKKPDANDLSLIDKIDSLDFNVKFKGVKIPDGFNTRQPRQSHGVNTVGDFYTKRNLFALSKLRELAAAEKLSGALEFLINSYDLTHSTLMSRVIFKGGGKKPVLTGYQSGTLYVSSLPVEKNIFQGILKQKLPIILRSFEAIRAHQVVSTGSASYTGIPSESVDYLFVDPPFGANIMYSELNYISESWSGVFTNDKLEAIENRIQNKSLSDYKLLMTACFNEAYRVLKKGRWMTVEFSNTKAAVWNSIQSALSEAGFIVANVSALDKKQGSFKAVTTPTAVKQDLIISAYKPSGDFEERFKSEAGTEVSAWDFVRNHLQYLPIIKFQENSLQLVAERDPRILFDQMVAYYVRKGFSVPISSQEFQIGLAQHFIERDGMYFLPEQVAEYDRKKILSGDIQQASLFVSDEATAIDWLRQLLKIKPQTFSDLNPLFMQHLGGWNKNEAQLDLRELLNQNFLIYDGKDLVPEQIHTYLSSNWKEMRGLEKNDPALIDKAKDRWYLPDPNKVGDLEKLRERALLKEFEEYKNSKKKLKVFRLEAVRAGFKKAWQERDYSLIVTVAEKIPNSVLEEDPKLLMWYDQAITRQITS